MTNKKTIATYLGLGLILIAIPLTLFILRRQQRAVPRAALPADECRVYADVVLAIDMSTTMEEPLGEGTRRSAAISAAQEFLNILDLEDSDGDGQRDRVGIVEFNRDARTLSELTSNRQQLDNALNQLDTQEFTAINKGLDEAKTVLEAGPDPAQERFIVLLSDGAINIHPDERGNRDQLDVLKESADSAKEISELYAIHFAETTDHIGYGFLRDYVVSQPADKYLLHSNLTKPDLESSFIRAAGLIKECPCPFSITAQVEHISDPGTPLEEGGFIGLGELNGTPQESIDYIEEAPEGVTQVIFDPGNLPEALRGSSAASQLTEIPDKYQLVERFCYNEGTALGCPSNLEGDQTISEENKVSDKIDGFLYACGAKVTYGWRVQEVEQPTINVCEGKACVTSDNPDDPRPTCESEEDCIESVCNEQEQCVDIALEDFDPQTDDSCTSDAECVNPTHTVCNAQDQCVSVDGAGADECVGDADCAPETHLECDAQNQCVSVEGAGTDQCTGDADCAPDTHLECVGKACQPVQGAGLNQCTSDDACVESICTSDNVCTEVAVSDLNDGDIFCDADSDCNIRNVCENLQCVQERSPGADECTTDTDCEVTYLTCEGLACVEKVGEKEDTCTSDDDCSRSVCDENNACVEVADTSGRADQCRSDEDCQPVGQPETHLECVEKSCQLIDGEGTDECSLDTDCFRNVCENEACVEVSDTTGRADECTTDNDCAIPEQETYLACVNDACQEVTGAGQDECSTREDCVRRICQDEACIETLSTSTEPDECSTDADCEVTEVAQPTYKTCLDESCVTLSGTAPEGTVLCETDADCLAPQPPEREEPVPTTGIAEGAFVTTVGAVILLLFGLVLFL